MLGELVERSSSLPHAISFSDAPIGNFFCRPDETVAIDWSGVSIDPLGADGGCVVGSALTWGRMFADVAASERELFESYAEGMAELDEHASPPNESEILVTINPEAGVSRNEMLNRLEMELKKEVPGAEIQAQQPLAHLISHMISGTYAQIAIKVYGDDLDTLRRTAEQIKAAIADVPGITNSLIDPIQRA